MTNETSSGPSAWDREIFNHLTSHVQTERGMLEEYSAIADKTHSEAFRYLVDLLIEDETRHHRIFQEIADSLKTTSLGEGTKPAVPNLDFRLADSAEVREGTNILLEKELEDLVELKRLKRELRDVNDTTLWGLLIELMQRDTDKHIAILHFVQKHAK
jgi:hypothetical protein